MCTKQRSNTIPCDKSFIVTADDGEKILCHPYKKMNETQQEQVKELWETVLKPIAKENEALLSEELEGIEKKVIVCGHCNLQGHIKQEFDCYGINRFICEYCGNIW